MVDSRAYLTGCKAEATSELCKNKQPLNDDLHVGQGVSRMARLLLHVV